MKLFLLIILFFINSSVFACSCFVNVLLDKIQNSEFIAKIKVLKVSEPTSDGQYQNAEIEVLELFKGNNIKSIKIYSNLNTSCNLIVSENTTWLVFANNDKSGLMQFGYCSGSIQLDRKFDLKKYPNVESNWKNSIDRKIALLRYFKSKNIRNPNEYNLQIKSISLSRDRFKGFEVNNEKFAVYELMVEKDLTISKIKTLKAFDNQKLSDSLMSFLKENKIASKKGKSVIKKRIRMIVVYYYYPAEENNQSFISVFDL
jgi:hypothetical protein